MKGCTMGAMGVCGRNNATIRFLNFALIGLLSIPGIGSP